MAQLALTTGRNIFVAFGRRTAGNWKVKQLEAALAAGLATVATPENVAKLPADLQGVVNQLLTTTEPIVVVDDTAAAAAVAPVAPAAKATKESKAPKTPKIKPAPEAPTSTDTTVAPAAAAAVAPVAPVAPATKAAKEPKAPKAPKEPKAPKPAKVEPLTRGIRYTNTRAFLCGQKIAEVGAHAGVTDQMVADVDAAYGEVNPRETEFAARSVWHAIRGYMGWSTVEILCECNSIPADGEGKLPTPVGVRYHSEGNAPRSYVAGQMIRELGLVHGLTDELVAKIDAGYSAEEVNSVESRNNARRAWHAIRGYFGITDEAGAVAHDASMNAA